MFMFNLWFTTVLLLVPNVLSKDVFNITASHEDEYLHHFGALNCTPNEAQIWHITVAETGIGLSVFLNETHLNPDNDEYIAISREEEMEGKNSSVTYITGDHENIALALPMVSDAFLAFYPGKTCKEETNFTILLKQYDEAPPELPTTTPNPNPPSGIRTEILIYLAGKTLSEFQNEEFQESFKLYVQKAAFNFSKVNNIHYEPDKLANETVFLKSEQTCSSKWPDYEKCVTAWMAVYVTKSRIDYELTVTHLEQLWDEIQVSRLPPSVGVQPYEFPNVSEEIGWWMLWIIIAVAITLLVALVLWKMEKDSILFGYQRKLEQDKIDLQQKHPEVTFRRNINQLSLAKYQKYPDFIMGNSDANSVVSVPSIKLEKKFKSKKDSSSPASVSHPANSTPTTYKFNYAKQLMTENPLPGDNEEN